MPATGTARTLKVAVDQLPPMECPQHRIVSLTGNIGPDGSAAYYNVIFSMADAIKARHFPMPLPVLCSSAEERELLHDQSMVRSTLALGAAADHRRSLSFARDLPGRRYGAGHSQERLDSGCLERRAFEWADY